MARAAVEEGIVAGGGTAYVNAIAAVEKLVAKVDGDEKTGVRIIAKALTEPVKQIATNAGIDGSVVLSKILESGKTGYGFDAYNEVYSRSPPTTPWREWKRRISGKSGIQEKGDGNEVGIRVLQMALQGRRTVHVR